MNAARPMARIMAITMNDDMGPFRDRMTVASQETANAGAQLTAPRHQY
jgi:hypothetical protein